MSDTPVSSTASGAIRDQQVVISEQALKKAEEFIEAEEGAANKLRVGWVF